MQRVMSENRRLWDVQHRRATEGSSRELVRDFITSRYIVYQLPRYIYVRLFVCAYHLLATVRSAKPIATVLYIQDQRMD